MHRLCSIDVGTSGARLSIYGEDLALEARYESRLELRYHGGRVEQDPLELLRTFRELVGKASRRGCKVLGISLYRGSVLAWRRGEPLSGIVTWMDSRGVEEYYRLPLHARIASILPGIGKALKPGSPALAMRSLARSHPGARIWSLDAFIAEVLTGEFTSDPGQAALTGLYNPYTLKPLTIVQRLLSLGLEVPKLAYHDEPLTSIEGMQVGPLVPDQQAASLGLACLRPGCIRVTLGTGMFISAPLEERPPLAMGSLVPLLNLATREERMYGVEGFAAGVGIVYEAFAKVLGGFRELEEKARMAREASPVVPVLAGLRTPYMPLLRGAVLGVAPGFTGETLARGLVAGTILTFLAIYREVKRLAGPGEVRVGGGLSRLGILVSGIAGSLRTRVYRSVDYNDSARGAALLAGYASGLLSRRELLNPSVALEEVEPAGGWPAGEDVGDWLRVIGVLSSRSFSESLERIRRSRS
ncbi:MAG: hypothetical protein F7B18_01915 [Desulfurococcales archaeon]|nr:hypothetical protein [Desulfurococcales archaeon]